MTSQHVSPTFATELKELGYTPEILKWRENKLPSATTKLGNYLRQALIRAKSEQKL